MLTGDGPGRIIDHLYGNGDAAGDAAPHANAQPDADSHTDTNSHTDADTDPVG